MLTHGEQMYGLQLVVAPKRRLKRGTVYVRLGRMEEKGYITSHLEDLPSRLAVCPAGSNQPTALGRRVLAAWTGGARLLMPEFAP